MGKRNNSVAQVGEQEKNDLQEPEQQEPNHDFSGLQTLDVAQSDDDREDHVERNDKTEEMLRLNSHEQATF